MNNERRTRNIELRPPHNSFRRLAGVAGEIEAANDDRAKVKTCSRYFSSIEDDEDLDLAARFFGEGVFPEVSGKHVAMGSRTLSTLAARFCEIDYEKVFKPCREAAGSVSETIELLLRNIPEARAKLKPENLGLKEVFAFYEELYGLSSRKEKQKLLAACWRQMRPLEVRYFIRIMRQTAPRIVPDSEKIMAALAQAFGQSIKDIRHAYTLTGSLGKTAVLAKNRQLDTARFTLFQPVEYMMPTSHKTFSMDDYVDYLAEEKLDGIRCQVHVKGEKVKLFSAELNDVTPSFPKIAQQFQSKKMPGIVLDGEICVFKDDTILPSQLLQKRLKPGKPSPQLLTEYPAVFIAFDLLFYDGHTAFSKKLNERRKLLSDVCQTYNLLATIQREVAGGSKVEQFFDIAVKHGSDGLVLKHKNSLYEYGQRSKAWLKIKKPGKTLTTVLMYAHTLTGEPKDAYSAFTLGISVRDDERYEDEFIPIGKACGEYTDEELKRLNQKIKEITVERYGPTLGLLPEIVIELEFDDIQINKRTKAKYSLHQTRLKSLRWDLDLPDVNTLKDVEQIFTEEMNQNRLSQQRSPAFVATRD